CSILGMCVYYFLVDHSTSLIHSLSLHDALPIFILRAKKKVEKELGRMLLLENEPELESEIINTFSRTIRTVEKERNVNNIEAYIDRKSTRLNSSHVSSSYAVFCSKKKMILATKV